MTAADESLLDNPVYEALTGPHARFAQRRGNAVRYRPDVAPFFGVAVNPTAADWDDAAELLRPEGFGAISEEVTGPPPAPWQTLRRFPCFQMVAHTTTGAVDPEATALSAADVPEILALVAATEPGPFMERTIELGTYLGIRREGRLVAMAGERMRVDGFTEISAVCTLPDVRGQGLASRLMSTLMVGIAARGERAFLHVLTSNAPAIRVYEHLGFEVRRHVAITVISPA